VKKYLYLGIFWTLIGVGSMVFDLVHDPPYFMLIIGPVYFPLGFLVVVFGLLNLLYYHLLFRQSLFTEEEAAQYAVPLEQAVPLIVDEIQAGTPVEDIAAKVEQNYGIPPLITMKYILTLGRMQKKL
jgi:hypothetical protein